MPPALPTQHDHDPAATTPMPKVEAMPQLPERTLAWLAERPVALAVIESVWDTLAELEAAGHPPRLLAALRFVLIHHAPTRAGHCRACRRMSWRKLWRRRQFPCLVWRQIRGELLGHLTLSGRTRTDSARSVSR
jgi:hypothetical protein